jgi:hypothetical protein
MNVEALHVTLQQSFSADASLRTPAEATIKNLKHVAGAAPMLLQVTAEKQVRRIRAANLLRVLLRLCSTELLHLTLV